LNYTRVGPPYRKTALTAQSVTPSVFPLPATVAS